MGARTMKFIRTHVGFGVWEFGETWMGVCTLDYSCAKVLGGFFARLVNPEVTLTQS
jgi:hypothetical protein